MTGAIVLSLIPGLLWLAYILTSSPRPPSKPLLLVAALAGAASPGLVLLVGPYLDRYFVTGSLVYFVVAVGALEELTKLLAVRLLVYPRKGFRGPWDGLLYSATAALGFATSENVRYLVGYGQAHILLGRSLLATPGHVLMSSFWGFGLGLHKTRPGSSSLWTLTGWALAAVVHGLYDWTLVRGWPMAAVTTLLVAALIFRTRVRESTLLAAPSYTRLVVECPDCHTLVRAQCHYCTGCGGALEAELVPGCRACARPWDGVGQTCPHCGAIRR